MNAGPLTQRDRIVSQTTSSKKYLLCIIHDSKTHPCRDLTRALDRICAYTLIKSGKKAKIQKTTWIPPIFTKMMILKQTVIPRHSALKALLIFVTEKIGVLKKRKKKH